MPLLVTAYAAAWAAVSTYVVWLAVQNRRLARRLERLEALAAPPDRQDTQSAKVA